MVSRRTITKEPSVSDPGPTREPQDDGLRAHLLDHTLRVLLRDGYRRFSMNAVATSAKASKETLYRHFGDKTGLLRAALVRCAALIDPLLHVGLESATTRHDRLRQLGRNYLHGCYLPEALALQRIAYADGEHGLGPLFAEEITERAVAVVEAEFAALGIVQPRRDAEVYLGMIQGKLHERIMLGTEIDDLERRVEEQVDHALQVMAPYLDAVMTPVASSA
jgi:AcrR family transcriptional regulator